MKDNYLHYIDFESPSNFGEYFSTNCYSSQPKLLGLTRLGDTNAT